MKTFNKALYHQYLEIILEYLDNKFFKNGRIEDGPNYWQEYSQMKEDIYPLCFE